MSINRIAQTTVKIMPPELCINCNTVEVVKYLMERTQLGDCSHNLYTIRSSLLYYRVYARSSTALSVVRIYDYDQRF